MPKFRKKIFIYGTQIKFAAKIITEQFLYAKKAFYGMGIYFTDMLDYLAFYGGGEDWGSRRANFGKVIPVNSTFSCVSSEVYYCKSKKKNIYDKILVVNKGDELDHFPTYEEIKQKYSDYAVEPNGIHFVRVEPEKGVVRNSEEIKTDIESGNFLGTEYVITERNQILSLYGLTFKRNEYFVIWKDPNFGTNNKFTNFLEECKLFMYKQAKMNAYFVNNTEKALEIIKRKQKNKIILISNIGRDLSGKRFVEIARKILGFKIVVLFFSENKAHFQWLQQFPNCLYTNDMNFYKEYILNYNQYGLLNLKNKIQMTYGINLTFDNDYFQFPNFKNNGDYKDLKFGIPTPYFKKVTIYNDQNRCVICMDRNGKVYFKQNLQLAVNDYKWYVTLLNKEITLYSNGSYLWADINQSTAIGIPYMKLTKPGMKTPEFEVYFEKINKDNNEYIIYFGNKNNVLTVSGNNARIEKENNTLNQVFKFVEQNED